MDSEVDRTLQIKNLGGYNQYRIPEYAPLIPAEENFILLLPGEKMISGNKLMRQMTISKTCIFLKEKIKNGCHRNA